MNEAVFGHLYSTNKIEDLLIELLGINFLLDFSALVTVSQLNPTLTSACLGVIQEVVCRTSSRADAMLEGTGLRQEGFLCFQTAETVWGQGAHTGPTGGMTIWGKGQRSKMQNESCRIFFIIILNVHEWKKKTYRLLLWQVLSWA